MSEDDQITNTQENPTPNVDSQNAYYSRILLQRQMAERRKQQEASNRSLFPEGYVAI